MSRITDAEYAAAGRHGYSRESYREYRAVNDQMQRVVRADQRRRRDSKTWVFGLVLVGAGLVWMWRTRDSAR